MITREEQAKLENKSKDFIINAGSPITAQALADHLGERDWHTANNILQRFKDEGLVTEIKIGKIKLFDDTERLGKKDFTKFEWKDGKLVPKKI